MPVPDGIGVAAAVPQAAIASVTMIDTSRRFIRPLMPTTANGPKSSAGLGAADAADRVAHRVDRLLQRLAPERRAVPWVHHDRRPDGRPIEERRDSGQRQVDATMAREGTKLRSWSKRCRWLPAGVMQPLAVFGEPDHHLDDRVRVPLGRSLGPG